MSLCPFSKFNKIFGIPGKGIHKFRMLDVAAADYFITLIGAFILSYLTQVPLILTTIILFVLGIFFHTLFGVPTSAVKYLGLLCN
jgi:hypothetical protein